VSEWINMNNLLLQYKNEVEKELHEILDYWQRFTQDEKQGGFWGKVDNDNNPDPTAPKAVVLNARILWTFSSAFLHSGKQEYFDMAKKAMQYIIDYFIDKEFGGVYWSVDYKGQMLNGRKQVYGLAFCIYGLSEYYKATDNKLALRYAIDLFEDIEKYSYDEKYGGYLEAFSREWKELDDLRLSAKDDNEKKTMNTHLHIIEAYANLYSVWADERLKQQIIHLLELFEKYMIDPVQHRLHLFFDEQWNVKSSLISFGHDIEAAWLLQECAEVTEHSSYIKYFKNASVAIADKVTKGLDNDGGLWYEYEPATDHLVKEKHSWPQAEAMIGFFNAWQNSGDQNFLHRSVKSWNFIKEHIKDSLKGEWFWGIKEDYSVMQEDKAGFWKCPYHNSRACYEIIQRISTLTKKNIKKTLSDL
jgi:cellobiose epimerase